ncbi:MAG: hypothetical protein JSR58_03685 [Verrucomicrobia bacterium]|nr:hypothetical protein [Verrucomicrobiota bacterium]
MLPLRVSSVAEPYNVSKWLKHQVLLDPSEMEDLFEMSFSLYNVSEVTSEPELSKKNFLALYREYIAALQNGSLQFPKDMRRYFSAALSCTPEALYLQKVREGSFLVKPSKPLVQLQAHYFLPSHVDGRIYPLVFGEDSVAWGLQFAYPQIFQGEDYEKVGAQFENTALFQLIGRWIREHTVPTTFIWNEQKVATPLRLGKNCFSWIHRHPQLLSKGIKIHVY